MGSVSPHGKVKLYLFYYYFWNWKKPVYPFLLASGNHQSVICIYEPDFIYIYIYTHTHTHTHMYMYLHSWVRKICWRRDRLPTSVFLGFPGGLAGKESTCNAGDLGSIPGLGRSPGEGNGYPFQYSGLENSMDTVVHGVAKSQTWLSDLHFHFHIYILDSTYKRVYIVFVFQCLTYCT